MKTPTSIAAQRITELLERDPEGNLRWRRRPPSMFDGNERICASWNARHAGKVARKHRDGRPTTIQIDGSDFNLRRLEEEFGEVIDAAAPSSSGMPLDEETAGFAGDSGKLAAVIRAAARSSGLMLDDLTVLARQLDPYRLDTPQGHRDGQWFADWLDELFPDTVVHLRGVHYVLVSTGGVMKPDRTPYQNTIKDFTWLTEAAAKAARWLGKVGFDRFKDQRNDDPRSYRSARLVMSSPGTAVSSYVFRGDRDSGFDVVIGTPWCLSPSATGRPCSARLVSRSRACGASMSSNRIASRFLARSRALSRCWGQSPDSMEPTYTCAPARSATP